MEPVTTPEVCASADVPRRPFPQTTENISVSSGTGRRGAQADTGMIPGGDSVGKGGQRTPDPRDVVRVGDDPELVALLIGLGIYPGAAGDAGPGGADPAPGSATSVGDMSTESYGVVSTVRPVSPSVIEARELVRAFLTDKVEVVDVTGGATETKRRRGGTRKQNLVENLEPQGPPLDEVRVREAAAMFVETEQRHIAERYKGTERTERHDALTEAWIALFGVAADKRPVFVAERDVQHWFRAVARCRRRNEWNAFAKQLWLRPRRKATKRSENEGWWLDRSIVPAEDVAAHEPLGRNRPPSPEEAVLRAEQRRLLWTALRRLPVTRLVAILKPRLAEGRIRKQAQRGRDHLRAIMSGLAS